jgi:nucleoside-diphosphate-sugar epimerase
MYGDSTTTLDEQSAYSPLSPYAVSKVAGEHLAEVYMRRAPGMRVTSLRFFNIYGPTEGTDAVIPSFVTRTLRGEPILIEGDGTQARDFTYIDDAICAISSIINDKTRYHRSINISSGQTHTIRELAEAVRSLLPWLQIRHTEGRPNEIRSFPSDSALLRECYRFQPRHTLAEGIAEVIRFYRPATEQPATLRCAL